MDFKFVKKKKGEVEVEFDEKEVAVALVSELSKNNVDAYTYEPHPLKAGFVLHVESDNAMADLKKAVDGLGKDWSQLQKGVTSKLK